MINKKHFMKIAKKSTKSVPPKDIRPKCPVVTLQSSIWAKGQKAGPHIVHFLNFFRMFKVFNGILMGFGRPGRTCALCLVRTLSQFHISSWKNRFLINFYAKSPKYLETDVPDSRYGGQPFVLLPRMTHERSPPENREGPFLEGQVLVDFLKIFWRFF